MELVICDGCLESDGRQRFWAGCDVRACGLERGMAYCACEKLQRFFGLGFDPHERARSDEIRRSL